jgi:hypothetical protein
MGRELDKATLEMAGEDYAAEFLKPTIAHPHNSKAAPIGGRGWVMTSLYNLHFKDEFAVLVDEIRANLGPKAVKKFDDLAGKTFKPRSDDVFEKMLADRLAITPNGKPIAGKIGLVKKGSIIIGFRNNRRGMPRLVKADVHVGESVDQAVDRVTKLHKSHGVEIMSLGQLQKGVGALNTRISNEAALGACDYVVDRLDEGSGAAIIQGRSGAQPADPDTAASGTLLFTLVCSDPAFGSAADANPGGRATASAITSDTSADATNTLGYCRGCASNDGATSLDDHIDGEAGTSGADFNFNTLAIVSGATVALTSWTVTMPES